MKDIDVRTSSTLKISAVGIVVRGRFLIGAMIGAMGMLTGTGFVTSITLISSSSTPSFYISGKVIELKVFDTL